MFEGKNVSRSPIFWLFRIYSNDVEISFPVINSSIDVIATKPKKYTIAVYLYELLLNYKCCNYNWVSWFDTWDLCLVHVYTNVFVSIKGMLSIKCWTGCLILGLVPVVGIRVQDLIW